MEASLLAALLHKRHILAKRHAAVAERRRSNRVKKYRLFVAKQARERMLFALMLTTACTYTIMKPGKVLWSKEWSGFWWDETVMKTFSDNDWLDNFRVSHTTFIYICNKIRSEIQKDDTVMRKACTVEKRVGVTLWFLSSGSDFRTIGHLFGISKSLVCLVVKEVCQAVCKILLPKYIKFPQGEDLQKVVDGFKRKYGFPQCIGVIDGSHNYTDNIAK